MEGEGVSLLGCRGARCTFCGRAEGAWQHDLDSALKHFRTSDGKGAVWGGGHPVCQSCETLYQRGDYAALARLQADGVDASVEDELIALAAFCQADLGARPLAEPSFPIGFEPLETFTGAEWVYDVWPADHRLSLPETRSPQLEQDPQARILLLRSPWPGLDLPQALNVLWSWAERDRVRDTELIRSRVAEALTWPAAKAAHWWEERGAN